MGFPYTMLSFYGLQKIKAAHAGVLVNGMLPVMGAIVAWCIFRQKLYIRQWAAVVLICLANLIMAGSDIFSRDHLTGIVFLLGAASIYTIHMTGVRLWHFTWKDVLLVVPVINVGLFLPIWFFLPTSLTTANINDIICQSLYQGILVNIIALTCVAYAIRHLGTMTVALFMSTVPVMTSILAWIFLQEPLILHEGIGILGCSLGLLLYAKGASTHSRSID